MGTVFEFAERLADRGDWTAAERAQLREVGAQMAGVDVVFGTTDLGDPWCAVTDERGEVMLHVARIGGDFLVHSTDNDRMVEGGDLWDAARRVLGDLLKERRGVLLTFPPEALGHTAVLAFMVAAALRGDFEHWRPLPEPEPHADPSAPAARDLPHGAGAPPAQGRGADPAPRHEASGEDPAPVKENAPASADGPAAPAAADGGVDPGQAPAQAEAPAPQPERPAPRAFDQAAAPAPAPAPAPAARGGESYLASTEAGVGFAPAARAAFVQGGDGADRIAVGGGAIATGGAGADTFALALPAGTQGEPALVGVVGDFREAEGDRLDTAARVVSDVAEADILAELRARFGLDDAPVLAGRRIGYDVDGDGRADAYVLVTEGAGGWIAAHAGAGLPAGDAAGPTPGPAPAPGPLGGPDPIGIVGQSPIPAEIAA